MDTRRHFLKKVGAGSAALAVLPALGGSFSQTAVAEAGELTLRNSMGLAPDASSNMPVGSWQLNYDGKISTLVLKKDASGKLTGTLSGQPISPSWNKNDQTITFVAKFDPKRAAEFQVFTGMFFEKSGETSRYFAGWAESSNGTPGTEHKRVARWYAR